MKRAYCSKCGEYVPLNADEACPGGHPRSCYRDVREVDAAGNPITNPVATPVGTSTTTSQPDPQQDFFAAAALPLSADGPVSMGFAEPVKRRWPWILVAVLGAGVLLMACTGVFLFAVIYPRVAAQQAAAAQKAAAAQQAAAQAATQPAESQPTATPVAPEGPYPPVIPMGGVYTAPTRDQKLWALAVTGILTQANGSRHDTLGGLDNAASPRDQARSLLVGSWGINGRADLLKTLTWIENGGHRKGFDTIAKALQTATPDQLAEVDRAMASNPDLANQVSKVREYSARLGGKSIAGWDYTRYIVLCRWGYQADYLSEDEALRRIMPAAGVIQRTFSSWKDLGDNYLAGREFWSLAQTQGSGAAMRSASAKLLSNRQSPWVKMPWGLELGQVKAP